MAIILDGEATARKLKDDLKKRVVMLKDHDIRPGLAAIRVGDDPASDLYVTRKMRACEDVGIGSKTVVLPEATTEEELLRAIEDQNCDPETSGILVQLPLPAHINTQAVIEAIDPRKDVDGFHPFNVGRVSTGVGGFPSCTPKGIMRLLEEHGLDVRGKDVVLVGASKIVGRPLVGLMLAKHATVTVCHIETRDLAANTRRAEILVAAAGRAGLVTRDMVQKGVVLVDVGINRVPDRSSPRGFRVVGDIAPAARELAYAWTPVPGGIGPMTVAMLIENTVLAAEAMSRGVMV